MNNLQRLAWVAVGVVAVVVVLNVLTVFGLQPAGGLRVEKDSFTQGLYAGFLRQFQIDNAGNVQTTGNASTSATLAVGTLKVDAGSGIIEHSCATATFNPGSLSTSTAAGHTTSTDIALTGAAVGDLCVGSLSSATTTAARVSCAITGNATATLSVTNVSDTGGLDYATGTARVCYFAY